MSDSPKITEKAPRGQILFALVANTVVESSGEGQHTNAFATLESSLISSVKRPRHVAASAIEWALYGFVANTRPKLLRRLLTMVVEYDRLVEARANIPLPPKGTDTPTRRVPMQKYEQIQLILRVIAARLRDDASPDARECLRMIADLIPDDDVSTENAAPEITATLEAAIAAATRHRDFDALDVIHEATRAMHAARGTSGRDTKPALIDQAEDVVAEATLRSQFSTAYGPVRGTTRSLSGCGAPMSVAMFGDMHAIRLVANLLWLEAAAKQYDYPLDFNAGAIADMCNEKSNTRLDAYARGTLKGIFDVIRVRDTGTVKYMSRTPPSPTDEDKNDATPSGEPFARRWRHGYYRGLLVTLAYLDLPVNLAKAVLSVATATNRGNIFYAGVHYVANQLPYMYTMLAENTVRAATALLHAVGVGSDTSMGMFDDPVSASLMRVVAHIQRNIVDAELTWLSRKRRRPSVHSDFNYSDGDIVRLVGGVIALMGAVPLYPADARFVADVAAGECRVPTTIHLAYVEPRTAFIAAGAALYMKKERVAEFRASLALVLDSLRSTATSLDLSAEWSNHGARGLDVTVTATRWLVAAAANAGVTPDAVDVVAVAAAQLGVLTDYVSARTRAKNAGKKTPSGDEDDEKKTSGDDDKFRRAFPRVPLSVPMGPRRSSRRKSPADMALSWRRSDAVAPGGQRGGRTGRTNGV